MPLLTLLGAQECDASTPAQLAAATTTAPTLWQAVEATRVALARGGVATRDLQAVYQDASAPQASSFDWPTEVVTLAQEERDREGGGRITLTRLADMLAEFGFELRDRHARLSAAVGS